jgi:hypothetical protein
VLSCAAAAVLLLFVLLLLLPVHNAVSFKVGAHLLQAEHRLLLLVCCCLCHSCLSGPVAPASPAETGAGLAELLKQGDHRKARTLDLAQQHSSRVRVEDNCSKGPRAT